MNLDAFATEVNDPFKIAKLLWPEVVFYAQQRELIYSVRDNDETLCVAGNMLGKDFTAGFLALGAFLFPGTFLRHPTDPIPQGRSVRVVATSVKDDHLRVLWGEINRFIQSCRFPLEREKGGPLIINHRDIRKIKGSGQLCPISYLRGMVSEKGEGLAGHHAPYTFAIADEASGIDDVAWNQLGTWAKRRLAIGNPNDCQNFFRRGVEAGDLPRA